jgi:hypothetical protein
MRSRFAFCLAILALSLVAALPASAQAADVVRPSSVTAGTVVPPGGARTVTLRCPALAVAVNAAVTRKGAGVVVQRSSPGRQAGNWSFRLVDAPGGGGRGAKMVLRCLRLDLAKGLSGARLVVSTSHRGVSVPAHSSFPVEVGCEPGAVATGYALQGGRRGLMRFASVEPTARGWSFVVENTGGARAGATVHGRCLKRRVAARSDRTGAVSLRLGITRRVFRNRVGPGTAAPTLAHRCRAREFSLATGSTVDPLDSIELAGSAPAGPRAGRWTFRGARRGDEVRTSLVCLSRGSRFR